MEENKPMKSRPSMDDDGPWDQGKLSHTFELIFDQVKLCTESAAGGRCLGMFAEGECWLRGSRELQQTLLCSENQKLEFIGEAEARVYWRTNFLEGSFRRRGIHLAGGLGRAEFILLPVRHSSPKLHPSTLKKR